MSGNMLFPLVRMRRSLLEVKRSSKHTALKRAKLVTVGECICASHSLFWQHLQLLRDISSLDLASWGDPVWSFWGLGGSSCLWHFSDSMGKSMPMASLGSGISFPPSTLVSSAVLCAPPGSALLPLVSWQRVTGLKGCDPELLLSSLFHGHTTTVFWNNI